MNKKPKLTYTPPAEEEVARCERWLAENAHNLTKHPTCTISSMTWTSVIAFDKGPVSHEAFLMACVRNRTVKLKQLKSHEKAFVNIKTGVYKRYLARICNGEQAVDEGAERMYTFHVTCKSYGL